MSIQNFLGLSGIKGPVYEFEHKNNKLFVKEDGSFNILDANGFYYVKLESLSDIDKVAIIGVSVYLSKKYFINQKDTNDRKKGKVKGRISFVIDNRDAVLGEGGTVITAGTFDRFFSKSVVRERNTCENDKALELVKSFDGNSVFQQDFPINFLAMTLDDISQANINNALA